MATGGDFPPEMDQDQEDKAELDLLRLRMVQLQRQYDDLAVRSREAARTPIVVEAPLPQQRLKVFTGLPPTGGLEVCYQEWEKQAEMVVTEKNAKDRLMSSLRGLAFEQAKDCVTASEIVRTLKDLFGEVRPADDLYIRFAESKIGKGEGPSDFFIRLWSDLTTINKTTRFDSSDFDQKLFRTFARALEAQHPLLALEIRNQFGVPGTVAPRPGDILRCVRQMEVTSPAAATEKARAQAHLMTAPPPPPTPAPAAMTDEDVARIATLVADILAKKQQTTRRDSSQCYNCGEWGHYARECPVQFQFPGDSQSTFHVGATRGGRDMGNGSHRGQHRGNGAGFPRRGSRGARRSNASTQNTGSSFYGPPT